MKSLERKIEEENDDTGLEDIMVTFARRIKTFNISNLTEPPRSHTEFSFRFHLQFCL